METTMMETPAPFSHTTDEEYLNLLTNEEREALAEFKKHSITEGLSDRRYLFARKLRVERAVTLLTNNLEFRKEHGIPVHITRDQVNDNIYQARSSFYLPCKIDKQGRAITYIVPSRLVPTNYPLRDFVMFMNYLSDLTQWEQPEYHRHGIVVVEDLADCGFKNFDSRLMKKPKGNKPTLEDLFPGRVQAIYLLNAPIIIRPLLKMAKLIMKKKIIQRVKILSKKEDLLEFIDKSQLHEHFGGDLQGFTRYKKSGPQFGLTRRSSYSATHITRWHTCNVAGIT